MQKRAEKKNDFSVGAKQGSKNYLRFGLWSTQSNRPFYK
jgi:hypothetical protein